MSELMSSRQVLEALQEHRSVNLLQVREILACGVLGTGIRTRGAVLWDADRVRSLTARPNVVVDDLPPNIAAGAFVARLRSATAATDDARSFLGFSADAERTELASNQMGFGASSDAMRQFWSLSARSRSELRARLREASIPFVATVGTLVVAGRDVTGIDQVAGGTVFTVGAAGPWFEAIFAGRWLNAGRGGPWAWWPR